LANTKFAELRENYALGGLLESDAQPDPLAQFHRWFDDCLKAGILEANAMSLATADSLGAPSVRIVLLKDLEPAGFVFFTNYESRKARELEENSRAALCFHWKELERQVRAAGVVHKLDREASAEYFRVRPRASQIGAWSSRQSSRIASRETLEEARRHYEQEFAGRDVPMPEFWGGYRLEPHEIEFWQGRPGRLHDRLMYVRNSEGDWKCERLAP
jgi:pyridoxamine 5'-phosphate oxidase